MKQWKSDFFEKFKNWIIDIIVLLKKSNWKFNQLSGKYTGNVSL